jgi:hypothetical protein
MLFPDMENLVAHPSMVPYEIDSPLWSDGAGKQRWISVPEGQKITMVSGALQLPVGSYAVKHFELPTSVTPKGIGRRLETRLMIVGTDSTYGLSYRWNAAGTDAELAIEPLYQGFEDEAAATSRVWHYPNSGQCWSCHRPENRLLGFVPLELKKTLSDGTDQMAMLAARGVFDSSVVADVALPSPSDTTASLEDRATSYLAANCSSCHHPRDQFIGYWDARWGVALEDRLLINKPHHNDPMAKALGLPKAPLIAPGNPAGSILLARMKSNDRDLRMPPLSRNLVDPSGVLIIEQWIASMPP